MTLTRRPVLLAVLPLWSAAMRAQAQRPPRAAQVGFLYGAEPPPAGTRWPIHRAFVERLRELGWTEGVNLRLEFRFGHGTAAGIAHAAGELVALKPDVLVASGTSTVRALASATRTIPIVMAGAGDPVGTGLVANLSRPGGNVTGVSMLGQEMVPKTLSLLREMLPKARRVDLVGSAANPGNDFFAQTWADAVRSAGVEGQLVVVPRVEDIEATIAAIRADAIVVLPDPMYAQASARLFAAATARRLPTANTQGRQYAEAGSLMSYSVSFDDMHRQAAAYVDRILRGANPAETPVEQLSRYQLIINLKAARVLGIEVPRTLLLRADEVIE